MKTERVTTYHNSYFYYIRNFEEEKETVKSYCKVYGSSINEAVTTLVQVAVDTS